MPDSRRVPRGPWDFSCVEPVFIFVSQNEFISGEVSTPLQLQTRLGDKLLRISIEREFRALKGVSSQNEETPEKKK